MLIEIFQHYREKLYLTDFINFFKWEGFLILCKEKTSLNCPNDGHFHPAPICIFTIKTVSPDTGDAE